MTSPNSEPLAYLPTTHGQYAPKSWTTRFLIHVLFLRNLLLLLVSQPFLLQKIKQKINTASAPYPEELKITPINIPRNQNIDIPGLNESDKSGENSGEWIKHSKQKDTVVLYIHGGAFIVGSAGAQRKIPTFIAMQSDAEVLNVNYRLSPEHKFPCALHDVVSAYLYLCESVAPVRIVVAGESAGGNLVLSLVLYLRDHPELGVGLPAAIVAISPWVDLTHSQPSATLHYKFDYLPKFGDAASFYTDHSNLKNPLVSPMFAEINDDSDKKSPLPPLLLQTGSLERLYHEDLYFVGKTLEKSAGSVTLEVYEDMIHVHHIFSKELLAKVALTRISKFIRETLKNPPPPATYHRDFIFIRNKQVAGAVADSDMAEIVSLRNPLDIVNDAKGVKSERWIDNFLRVFTKDIDYAFVMHAEKQK